MTLCVRDLGVRFLSADGPPHTALHGINLTVERGELVGITGTSGAGKSLVAQALAGALPRTAERSGIVEVPEAKSTRARIALVPQQIDALDPLARIGRQITRFAALAGREVSVTEALSAVGLPPRTARLFPHQLSGGMARRALLATSLATGADWLVADEPTVGLDGPVADQIMALLVQLAEQGHGVIVISHDLPRLTRAATRIVVMQDGQMVETAPAAAFDDAGAALSHPFSRALWRAQPC